MNYISLGFFCSVAMELERLGLRKESSPFDWLISDFKGVIQAIDDKFEDFLEYDLLFQNKEKHEIYKNSKYNVHFYHDFDKYTSLEEKLPIVKDKYNRRIARFYDTISKPTLFIRYISDEELENGKSKELIWIEDNYEWIMQVLKSYNADNEILFIANEGVISDKIFIYNVEKDDNDVVARKPIEKNQELCKFFDSIQVEGREENIARYLKKEKSKKSNLKKVRKYVRKIFCKEYIHGRQY
ncbi:MAG: hypothetical protein E7261_02340 [Lachnospiraceae bacterium]|nr:hypothetical protein [Lachnospiraceae bacterium]